MVRLDVYFYATPLAMFIDGIVGRKSSFLECCNFSFFTNLFCATRIEMTMLLGNQDLVSAMTLSKSTIATIFLAK